MDTVSFDIEDSFGDTLDSFELSKEDYKELSKFQEGLDDEFEDDESDSDEAIEQGEEE